MVEPLISVIIPTHNRSKAVLKAVRSIAAQTHQNLEIIVVDDGSSDRTLEMLRAYQQHEPRLHIISQNNQGISAARNAALNSAHGDYYALADDDDRSLPKRLETQLRRVQEIEKQSPGTPIICTSDFVAVDPAGEDSRLRYRKVACAGCETLEVVVRQGFPPPSTWFFTRQTLDSLSEPSSDGSARQFFDPTIHSSSEDAELLMRALRSNAILTNVNEPLAIYALPRQGKQYRNGIDSDARTLEKHGGWILNLPRFPRNEILAWFESRLPFERFTDVMQKVTVENMYPSGPPEDAGTGRSTLRQITPGVNIETADASATNGNNLAKSKTASPQTSPFAVSGNGIVKTGRHAQSHHPK